MLNYDVNEIKEKITTDAVFEIVHDLNGEPRWTDFGFISATICHNLAGEGSHKLYYYENTQLFRCYTGCDSTFDIFGLLLKVKLLSQPDSKWTLNDAVRWIASRLGIIPRDIDELTSQSDEWIILNNYEKMHIKDTIFQPATALKVYDSTILKNLSYPLIADWVDEGMTREVLRYNQIGYYPTSEQITIPHYDINGNFIGLRGRALGREEAEKYGKYRPLSVGFQMYNHPLSLNLYNLNHSKKNIALYKKVIVFEGEKSCLLYQSYFGIENDISVACCGSNISSFQIQLLLDLGVQEIIVAFDRQFKEKGDAEFKHLTTNLRTLHSKYNQYATISFMFDKDNKLPYKASPIDSGRENFLAMFQNRIFL